MWMTSVSSSPRRRSGSISPHLPVISHLKSISDRSSERASGLDADPSGHESWAVKTCVFVISLTPIHDFPLLPELNVVRPGVSDALISEINWPSHWGLM